jgi:hypothetical protein
LAGFGTARAKNNGFARSKPASKPVIIVEPGDSAGRGAGSSRFRTKPSASEPALPEAEPGQPAPADVQAQEPWHQEHRRSVQPEHSSSGQPGHSRSEPELRKSGHRPSELRRSEHTERHSRNHRSSRNHSHGDGGDDGDSHIHHIHRRSHHIRRRSRRMRTGQRTPGLAQRPRALLRPPWPESKSCEASAISSSFEVLTDA